MRLGNFDVFITRRTCMTAPGDALDRGVISLQQGHSKEDYDITVGRGMSWRVGSSWVSAASCEATRHHVETQQGPKDGPFCFL